MASSPRSTASSDLYSLSETFLPEAAPIPNGVKHEVSHKRKWEEDSKSNSALQNNGESPNFLPRSDRRVSSEQVSSPTQAEIYKEHLSRIKRPRINGYSFGAGTDLSCTSSALPAALWQHIFCYVPPVFLGRLISVNRAFNAFLTPGKNEEDPMPLSNSVVQPLKADSIWAISRRRYCPGLPRPIRGLNELEMWKLLRGNSCQICESVKFDTPSANLQDPWESGPGDTGVRIVWPFGLRCCGPCLRANTQKVLDCRRLSLVLIRRRRLTVDRKWISPCRRIARFSSCRGSLLLSYQKSLTTLAITSCEASQRHLCCA